MSATVECACGAKLRVAPELAGRTVRCPKCGSTIPTEAATEAAPAVAIKTSPSSAASANESSGTVAASSLQGGQLCAICHTAIQPGELIRTCPSCDIVHHEECWAEIGGCGTFGCTQAPAVEKSDQSSQAPLTAWGDTKDCPICGETIKSIALKCRYCGEKFSTIDPLTARDVQQRAVANADLESFKRIVMIMFGLSIVAACLAPLMVIVSAVYLLPRRAKLAKCGPLFTIMGWTTFALSCVYSLLILLFVLLEN